MSDQTYCVYADYGPSGCPPGRLELEYDSSREYSLPETLDVKLSCIWEELTDENSELHNGKLMNLLEVSESGHTIHLGPAFFRDYFAIRSSLYEKSPIDEIQLTDEEAKFIQQNIKPISSYMAVVAGDKLVVGVKKTNVYNWLSFPGSGYLDAEMDTTDCNQSHSPGRILRRELDEELDIAEEVKDIHCLGVFSEKLNDYYINPAIFSVATVDCSASHLLESAQDAQDSWEFEILFTVPIREKLFEALIEGNVQYLDSVIPESASLSDVVPSPKAPLMLALLGRKRFGEDWYQTIISKADLEVVGK